MSTIEKTPAVVIKDKTDDVYGFEVLKSAEYADGSGFGKGAWDARKGIPALVGKAVAAVQPWQVGQAQADLAVVTIGKAVLGIRRLVTLQNGEPDWAGNSYAYAAAFDAHLGKAMSDAKLGKDAQKRLRGNVREYMSANQATLAAVVAHVVDADPALSDLAATVKGKDMTGKDVAALIVAADPLVDGVAVKDLPAPIVKAVQAQYANQTTKTGKALNGFQAVPEKLGKRERGKGSGRTPEAEAGARVDQATATLAATKLTQLERTMGLGYVVTGFVDGLIGKPSEHEKTPEMPDLGADREAIIALIDAQVSYLGNVVDYLNGADGAMTRKDLYLLRTVRPDPAAK